MNFIIIILVSALIGTTVMNIVSYCLSNILNNQFEEPVLLNTLLKNSTLIREMQTFKTHSYSIISVIYERNFKNYVTVIID